jgi:SAM-dependent methyltransferase
MFQEADVIHIHGGIWRSQVAYGLLRRLFPETPLVVHLHGSEARTGRGLHHLGWADAVLCSTPDLKRYVPRAQWVPNPYFMPKETVPPSEDGKFIIGHFPTQRALKGTDRILQAFRDLAAGEDLATIEEGGITKLSTSHAELWIVEGVSHTRSMELMRKCDIVIDQVTPWGAYGMVSVEGMALGKVVVCSHNPEYYEGAPLVQAPPESLTDVLRELFARREEWRRMGEEGRAYVMRTHEASQVAGQVLRGYYELLSQEPWDEERARRYWLERGRGYLDEFRTGRIDSRRYRRQEASLDQVLARLAYREFVEVGCGFGRITRLLARKPGAEGCGIDLSVDQLRGARRYLGDHAVPFVRADVRFLPLKDGSADLVLAAEVLMHMPPEAMRKALAEMARVARRYVVNLDWYESYAVGVGLRFSWIHDYVAAYAALGLSVTTFPVREPGRQMIFVAVKGGVEPEA